MRNIVWTQIDPPPLEAEQAMRNKGWNVRHAPLKHMQFLETSLPEQRDLLLVSSKYAAQYVANYGGFQGCPFACVGQQSKSILEAAGLIALWQPSPTASELARLLPNVPRETRILFVTGTMRRPTLEATLNHLGFDFQVAEVYSTQTTQPLPKIEPHELAIFFAPSAVEDYDQSYPPPDSAIAIGPTTAKSMHQAGWTHYTSPEPSWQAILKTLETHYE